MLADKTKADIITIRSTGSSADTDRRIKSAVEGLRIKNDDKLKVTKAGTAIRVTGENAAKPGNGFAVEIASRDYDGYTEIDLSALGGSTGIDYEESVQIRSILLEELTAEYRDELDKRLKYLKGVRRREVARKLSQAREADNKKKDSPGKDAGGSRLEKTAYEVCLNEHKLLEEEIAAVTKELEEYDTGVFPETDAKESIFSFNVRYSGLTMQELSLKTGISMERIMCISKGQEPLLSELISLSTAFDVPVEDLIFNEWYNYYFGEYYNYSGDTFAECVEKKDLRQLAFLASTALLKYDDTIIFKGRYRVKPESKPDEELLDAARRLLLENEMPETASRISTEKSYITVHRLSELNVPEDIAFRYLFAEGRETVFSYFIPFFNGLEDENDKEHLLNRLRENLGAYMNRQNYSRGEYPAGGKYISYTEKTGDGLYILSRPWVYRDFSVLETVNEIKEEIIELQDKLFCDFP